MFTPCHRVICAQKQAAGDHANSLQRRRSYDTQITAWNYRAIVSLPSATVIEYKAMCHFIPSEQRAGRNIIRAKGTKQLLQWSSPLTENSLRFLLQKHAFRYRINKLGHERTSHWWFSAKVCNSCCLASDSLSSKADFMAAAKAGNLGAANAETLCFSFCLVRACSMAPDQSCPLAFTISATACLGVCR